VKAELAALVRSAVASSPLDWSVTAFSPGTTEPVCLTFGRDRYVRLSVRGADLYESFDRPDGTTDVDGAAGLFLAMAAGEPKPTEVRAEP
jgi:hypothetical protein